MSLTPREESPAVDRATRRGGSLGLWGRAGTWLVILFLLAAGLRVGWVLARWGPAGRSEDIEHIYPDEKAYVLGARSLAAGQGLTDEFGYRATYMPGYPAFLAVFQALPRPLLWARIVQAILAAWVAPATFLLAWRFVGDATGKQDVSAGVCHCSVSSADRFAAIDSQRSPSTADTAVAHTTAVAQTGDALTIPLLAGLAAAFDPFLIFFSGLLLTEALFAAVLVTAWIFLQKRGRSSFLEKACAPFFLWLAVMLRPSAAVLVVLTPLALVVLRRFSREAIIQAVMIPAIVMLGLLPWAVRNQMVIGQWRWLSTRGGVSLYDGLQPGANGGSDLGHTKEMPEAQGLSEVEWDGYFRSAAWAEARRDPGRLAWLAGRKFLRTWSPIPNVEEYHSGRIALISAAWMLPMLAFAAIGWWRYRHAVAAWALLLLPVVAFTLLHMIYVGSVRYRVPLMPFVMVLSAAGLVAILERILSVNKTRA